ncbi:hypothetical protein FPANT_93 [Fusarium pseudoanthophilum]|uniref:Uncharacterized protein n=1 Tax=Fusarium pseudoanthophilum TaxID=48495 RepID=A0A8H5Q4U6_9HYPO|nr:hypothetical protein FPANT_93 [Fusarium pseudoanthophilum]
MAIPSNDFTKSLKKLFSEAGTNGRDAETEFIHLRGSLIDYMTTANGGGLSAAKARAKHNLKFTDGTEPETHIALFPSNHNITEKRPQLDAATTAEEFIGIIGTVFSEQKSQSRKKKRPNRKRSNATPPDSPMNNAQKRLEAEAANKTLSTADDSPRKRIKLNTSKSKGDISEPAVFSTAHQSNDNTPTELPSPEDTFNDDGASGLGSMDIDSGATSSQDKGEEMNGEQGPAEGQKHDDSGVETRSQDREDAHMNDADTETLPAYCRSDILEVVTAVEGIEEQQWKDFKPKLLEMLGHMHQEPTPEQHERALKRLSIAIAQTEQERSLIPVEAWKKYEEKLTDETKKGLFDCLWSRRLFKVGKIIYLPEEEVAMESQCWERLKAAARICAILIEMTAKPEEQDYQRDTDRWLIEKLGDISFLEKLFACKDRLGAVRGPGAD